MCLLRLRRTTFRIIHSSRTEIMALSLRGARKRRFRMKLERTRIERMLESCMRMKSQKLRVTMRRRIPHKKKIIKRSIRLTTHQKMRRWPMQRMTSKRKLK